MEQHRLRGLADLRRATLILTQSEPQAWPDWLRTHGVKRLATGSTLAFEQLYFALQAALDSLGVALVPAAIVASEVEGGRLRALSTPQGPVSPAYALLWPKISPLREPIHTLSAWLKSAAEGQ
jgi:LysR family glycine cleavage system transcriptional activator